jgi:ATP phosphoribosyltransferase
MPLPLRLCYAGKVYRQRPEGGDAARETFQLGAELIGDAGRGRRGGPAARPRHPARPRADRLPGQPRRHPLRPPPPGRAGPEAAERSAPRSTARTGRRSAARPATFGAPAAVARALVELPELIGRGEVLRRARSLASGPEAEAAIERLARIDALLERGGAGHVVYDLGEIRGLGYYTGIQFEVFVAGWGGRWAFGGRYDDLLALYGTDRPGGRIRAGDGRVAGSAGEGRERPPPDRPPQGADDGRGAPPLRAASALPCRRRARESRRLILPSEGGRFEFLPVKSGDVPVYVESGVADAGVVGSTCWTRARRRAPGPSTSASAAAARRRRPGGDPVSAPFPAGLRRGWPPSSPASPGASSPTAGMQVEIIRISGSVEIAPLLGLADWIVDLVETGRTLRENGLQVVDEVGSTTARLIVNRASHKLRLAEHQRMIADLQEALRGPGRGWSDDPHPHRPHVPSLRRGGSSGAGRLHRRPRAARCGRRHPPAGAGAGRRGAPRPRPPFRWLLGRCRRPAYPPGPAGEAAGCDRRRPPRRAGEGRRQHPRLPRAAAGARLPGHAPGRHRPRPAGRRRSGGWGSTSRAAAPRTPRPC